MRRVCVIVLLGVVLAHVIALSAMATEKLTILHVNDFHGRVFSYLEKIVNPSTPSGGAAYLAEMVNRERARNPKGTILLSAGDMFQGTPVSNLFHGRPVIDMMNMLHFDAMALGNHEFDWGRDVLADIVREAAFPVVSANIVDKKGQYLPGVRPYAIVQRKGLKVAVIGLTTPETPFSTKMDNVSGLTFLDPKKVLPGLIKEVRDKGARIVVLLTHLGLPDDRQLAEAVPGIDVIVGGHTHTVLIDPVIVGRTIIVQAGYNGLYLGVLELILEEKTGKIVDFTKKGELKPVSAGLDDKFDKRMKEAVDRYGEAVKEKFRQVVGETKVDLLRNAAGESNLGDAIADAMRESAGAQIAIQNRGGIRADIPAGVITMEQVYTVLPFDNLVVAMDLKGADLLRLFEKNASTDKGALQTSGVTICYDLRAPAGKRVVEMRVSGQPLDAGKTYRVATNDFLSAGGDGLADFRKGENIVYGGALRDAFVDYLKRYSPLSPRIEGRITVVDR